MLVFDFDGVLHDSRQRAWQCYQTARTELRLWDLPDLAGPDDLRVVYQGVLSASLTRWVPFEVAERFWKRHAELTAQAAAGETAGIIPELASALAYLAKGPGYGVVTGSHRSTVHTLLRRSLADEAMPRVLLSRDEPGSKTAKLRILRQQYGATGYVGDTGSDVWHARAAGLQAIAVAYGYAGLDDLTGAEPDRLLTTPADVAAWCQAQPSGGKPAPLAPSDSCCPAASSFTTTRYRRATVGVVALLGPPGSGKSTVAAALTAQCGDVRVFRLREFAHQQARTDHTVSQALASHRDPLGWLPHDVATLLVKRALDRSAPSGGVLLLESYPGTPDQAHTLLRDLSETGCRGGGIELAAPYAVLRERIAQRVVCPACDPQRRRPATRHPDRPTCCASCGTELQQRTNDAPQVAARRLSRYQRHIVPTRAVLQAGGLAWHTVDASGREPLTVAAALSAFHSLLPAPPKGQA